MSTLPDERLVAAAGGAVWRTRPDGELETAVVHRPRYDDWSLPKGKLDPGESALAAAVREVGEETGLRVTVGRRSVRTRYAVRQGRKQVDYWLMHAVGGAFQPNDEVDELRWLSLPDAAALVTHDHDRAVLDDLARTDVPRCPALLLVRHASAGDKHDWDGPDELRPLDGKGRRQAARLATTLALFAPASLASALPVRCRQTVQPLAELTGLGVRDAPEFGESEFQADPQAALGEVQRLLTAGADGGPTVICSQGGAIPSLLLALGVRWEGAPGGLCPPAAKGSVWALSGPGAQAADYYRDVDPAAAGEGAPSAL